MYTVLGDVSIFVVGKDEYDELACEYTEIPLFTPCCFCKDIYSVKLTDDKIHSEVEDHFKCDLQPKLPFFFLFT